MNQSSSILSRPLWLPLAFFTGIVLRLLLPWLGHNYDVESWRIVGDLVQNGQNVFAETDRHNYGPGFFPVFGAAAFFADILPWRHPELFHFLIALVLTLSDLGIAWLLLRKAGKIPAIIFLLHPVSILITGFHSQVDTLAILLGFAAWLILESENRTDKKILQSALLMSASLIFKHTLIFLPLWFLMDPRWKNPREKIIYLLLVYTLFLSSFLPFCGSLEAQNRILQNVFQYSMGAGNALVSYLVHLVTPLPLLFQWTDGQKIMKYVFIALMLLAGRFIMRREPENSFYLYLAGLVALSSQMADQYLVLPIITCAVFYKNRWLWIYSAFSALFILGSPFNLYLWPQLTGLPFLTSVYKNGFWWHYHCQIWILLFLFNHYFQLRPSRSQTGS